MTILLNNLFCIAHKKECVLNTEYHIIMGPWYSGTQYGMRILRLEFKSQKVPRDVDLGQVNFTIA